MNDAGDARADEFAHLLHLDVAIVVGDRKREMETLTLEALRQHVRDHRVEGAADVRDEQSDQMTGAAAHDPRRGVRDIAEFVGHDAHPLLGFAADVRMIGQRPADRRYRKIELLRDMSFIVIMLSRLIGSASYHPRTIEELPPPEPNWNCPTMQEKAVDGHQVGR